MSWFTKWIHPVFHQDWTDAPCFGKQKKHHSLQVVQACSRDAPIWSDLRVLMLVVPLGGLPENSRTQNPNQQFNVGWDRSWLEQPRVSKHQRYPNSNCQPVSNQNQAVLAPVVWRNGMVEGEHLLIKHTWFSSLAPISNHLSNLWTVHCKMLKPVNDH